MKKTAKIMELDEKRLLPSKFEKALTSYKIQSKCNGKRKRRRQRENAKRLLMIIT